MCFCSRRAYDIENMIDIKNFKNFIMQQFVDFDTLKYEIQIDNLKNLQKMLSSQNILSVIT
jgi:hypothetical protein